MKLEGLGLGSRTCNKVEHVAIARSGSPQPVSCYQQLVYRFGVPESLLLHVALSHTPLNQEQNVTDWSKQTPCQAVRGCNSQRRGFAWPRVPPRPAEERHAKLDRPGTVESSQAEWLVTASLRSRTCILVETHLCGSRRRRPTYFW